MALFLLSGEMKKPNAKILYENLSVAHQKQSMGKHCISIPLDIPNPLFHPKIFVLYMMVLLIRYLLLTTILSQKSYLHSSFFHKKRLKNNQSTHDNML